MAFQGSNNPFFGPDKGKPDHGPAGQHKHLTAAMLRRLNKKKKGTQHKSVGRKAISNVKPNPSKGYPGLKNVFGK